MKDTPKTQYRFYRPRRPEGVGAGLRLEGVTHLFGLVGSAMLILIGIAMLLMRNPVAEADLVTIEMVLQAPPYQTRKVKNTVLLPATDARILALEHAAYTASNKNALMALKKGDSITVGMAKQEANNWNQNKPRKDYFKAITLQKKGGEHIISFQAYHQKANQVSSQGWWAVLLGILFIPYQFIQKPKLPIWAAIGIYLLAMAVFFFW